MHKFPTLNLCNIPILCCLYNRGTIRPSHKQSAASTAHTRKEFTMKNLFTDLDSCAWSLYDGGWRSTDREWLQADYSLTDAETDALTDALRECERTLQN